MQKYKVFYEARHEAIIEADSEAEAITKAETGDLDHLFEVDEITAPLEAISIPTLCYCGKSDVIVAHTH